MTYFEKLTKRLQEMEGEDIDLLSFPPKKRAILLINLKLYEDTIGKNAGFVSVTFSNDFSNCRVSNPAKVLREIACSDDKQRREEERNNRAAAKNKQAPLKN